MTYNPYEFIDGLYADADPDNLDRTLARAARDLLSTPEPNIDDLDPVADRLEIARGLGAGYERARILRMHVEAYERRRAATGGPANE